MIISRWSRVLIGLAWLASLLAVPPAQSLHAAAPARLVPPPPAQPAVAGDALWDSRLALGANDGTFAAVFAPNGDLYVGGDFTRVAGLSANHVARWNAATNHWSALGSGAANGVNNRVYALAIAGNVLYIGGAFNQAGGGSAKAIAGWNLNTQTWSTLNGGMLHAVTGPSVNALAADGSNVYAGGSFDSAGGVGAQNIARWNGAAWSALSAGAGTTNDVVEALAVSGSDVYAGGRFTTPGTHLAHYNGAAWSQLGSGVNGDVLALALSGGTLYAGGAFTIATDGSLHTVNYIAQWSIGGAAWSALDTGLDGPDAGAIAIGPDGVYVTGRFQHAGGNPASRVALWNGSAWSYVKAPASFVDGVNANGYALAVHGQDVIVTGGFTTAGGWPAPYLARWNATDQQWYSPGNSVNGTVNAVAVSGNDVYVAGEFTSAGGLAASSVAQWNAATDTWSALGAGLAGCTSLICLGPVGDALAVNGDFVYVGGNFTAAGGGSAQDIARWDGVNHTWNNLGGGVSCGIFCSEGVYALTPDGAGVDVGGHFITITAGAVTANNLARWTGSAWQTFANVSYTGTNGPVYAIAPDAFGGYNIGGDFTSPRTNYVYFDGSDFFSLLSAPNAPVRALAVTNNAIYIGGDFTNAGSSGADHIAQAIGIGDWQPLGASLNNSVYSLALRGNTLFAGGTFTQTGVLGLENIAAWDLLGSHWSNLGSGADGPILSVATDANFVYAGGLFGAAGGKVSNFLGRWGQYQLFLPTLRR